MANISRRIGIKTISVNSWAENKGTSISLSVTDGSSSLFISNLSMLEAKELYKQLKFVLEEQ